MWTLIITFALQGQPSSPVLVVQDFASEKVCLATADEIIQDSKENDKLYTDRTGLPEYSAICVQRMVK